MRLALEGSPALAATRPSARASLTSRAETGAWGWLPALSLVASAGLLLIAFANTLSRTGDGRADALFWAGFLTLVLPFTVRLASTQAGRGERLGLVVVLGLAFYLVKVMHSPYAFTFSDELLHVYHANNILHYGALYHPHPILPVIAYYPGLESVTAALATLSGLPVYPAGLLVVGAARLILSLAIFLFFEQVSAREENSTARARVAGLAALLYMAHPNYLYWSAQFSYESLSLPLALLVVYAVARRERLAPGAERTGLTVIAVLGLLAVVVTHHLTSYALVALLWLASILYFIRARRVGGSAGPWGLALVGLAATVVWMLFVASLTVGYLSTIFGRAIGSVIEMIAGEAAARQLFQSDAGQVAPLWERLIGFGSVGLLALAQPAGLRHIWRRGRLNVFGLVLAGGGLAYFGMLALRFTQAGWETGNRASEFLFVGLAFLTALGALRLWGEAGARALPLRRALAVGGAAIIFMGGVIAGWPRDLRSAQPFHILAGRQLLEPQGMTAARWTLAYLGPDNRIAADTSNSMLLLDFGDQFAFSGRNDGFQEVIAATPLADWQLTLLRQSRVRYLAVDRRRASWDNMAGLYFAEPPSTAEQIDPRVFDKFERQDQVSRILDSGNIVLYDVGALSGVPAIR